MNNLALILESLPDRADWQDIKDFSRLDDRASLVNALHPNLVGLNDGSVEWCPNQVPPSLAEKLAWVWILRPDLTAEIYKAGDSELIQQIEHYQTNQ